jgi:hypothetical protein
MDHCLKNKKDPQRMLKRAKSSLARERGEREGGGGGQRDRGGGRERISRTSPVLGCVISTRDVVGRRSLLIFLTDILSKG